MIIPRGHSQESTVSNSAFIPYFLHKNVNIKYCGYANRSTQYFPLENFEASTAAAEYSLFEARRLLVTQEALTF